MMIYHTKTQNIAVCIAYGISHLHEILICVGSFTKLCSQQSNVWPKFPNVNKIHHLYSYSISQEICTRFCFAVLCCGYTLTDFPISIRLTSLALWQSNDCPSASKATLMNMDKYFMWIHYERLRNHKKSKAQQNRVYISWDILYVALVLQYLVPIGEWIRCTKDMWALWEM